MFEIFSLVLSPPSRWIRSGWMPCRLKSFIGGTATAYGGIGAAIILIISIGCFLARTRSRRACSKNWAISYEPAFVWQAVLRLFAEAASGGCPAEELET